MTMQEIAANVFIATEFYGGNVAAVVTDEGIVCIDTPALPTEARRWRSQLAHLSSKPIALVINTSHNPARVLGNRWFNAPVVAHEQTVKIISTHPEMYRAPHVLPETHENLPELAGVRPQLPELSFSNGLTLYRGGLKITTEHRAGPAASACWVHLPEQNISFIGDTIVTRSHPLLYTADLDVWLDELRDLTRGDFSGQLIPGQGQPDQPFSESTHYLVEYLRYLRDQLRRLARAGKSEEELLAFIPNILKKFPPATGEHNFVVTRLTLGLPTVYRRVKAAIGLSTEDEILVDPLAEPPPTETTE